MSQHRGPLLLILFAVILVSGGYASPIHKSAINRDFAFHSAYAIHSSTSTDDWLGGTGNWSNPADWTGGLPGTGSDVYIDSGGNDLVYLDTSASIASLTLGGDSGTSQLVDNGTPQTLTIAGALTVYQTGALYLAAGNTVTAGADSSNAGFIQLENGSALQVNGNLSNSGTIYLGYLVGSAGNLTVTGELDNTGVLQLGRRDAFSSGSAVNLGSLVNAGSISVGPSTTLRVDGAVNNTGGIALGFQDGELGSQAHFGSLVNSGAVEIGLGSALTVAGDVNNTATGWVGMDGMAQLLIGGSLTNSGSLITGRNWGGDEVHIGGGLTNSGQIALDGSAQFYVAGVANNPGSLLFDRNFGSGAHAAFGGLVNSGSIEMNNGSGFVVSGIANNSGSISALWGDEHIPSTFSAFYLTNSGSIYSNFEVGWLNNSGTILLQHFNGYGAVHGNLTNSGDIALADGGYLIVGRDVINSGHITTDYGVNSINIAGRLINTSTGSVVFNGGPEVINLGNVVNQGTLVFGGGNDYNVTGGPHAGTSALSGFINSGIVSIGPDANLNVVGNYTQTAGQTNFLDTGTLRVQGRGMAVFGGGSVYSEFGTISGPVFSNAAISLYQLSILGNYTQGPNGSLTFDIAGTAPGEYDQLNISGHAQFNGLMTVDLLHGFVPDLGDAFDIVHFASESGTFSMVLGLPINGEEHFVLEYNATDLTLDVVSGALLGADNDQATLLASNIASSIAADGGGSGTASGFTSSTGSHFTSDYGRSSPTPEPGTLLLLGSGLLCAGYTVRRRMTK
ncbi:MAG TPA: PEP-CTERM sorting domain-containing protein [Candidatus Limnocylindrales bacterium]|jgi:hypothetical protein|nr:PEP-CTERM sorting domain-containing protein [Candidatus Limnocylindrales bacterium]